MCPSCSEGQGQPAGGGRQAPHARTALVGKHCHGGCRMRPACSELSWDAACIAGGIPAAAADAEQRAATHATGTRC